MFCPDAVLFTFACEFYKNPILVEEMFTDLKEIDTLISVVVLA